MCNPFSRIGKPFVLSDCNSFLHLHISVSVSLLVAKNSFFPIVIRSFIYTFQFLFLCLWLFVSLENFSFIAVEGSQILTLYPWHYRPLSNEVSLACHTYCETGHSLKWSFPRTRDTHACYYDLNLSRLGFEHPTIRLRGERSNAAVIHSLVLKLQSER